MLSDILGSVKQSRHTFTKSFDKERAMSRKNITSLAIVVVIGTFLWAVLVVLDHKSAPADAAVSFACDYYRLSPSMTEWMCGALNAAEPCSKSDCSKKLKTFPKAASGDESTSSPKTDSGAEAVDQPETICCKKMARHVNTAVENYLYKAKQDAAERGFGENSAKYTLYHIETQTEQIDDTTALVHLTAQRRLEINPLFAYVGRLFRIGETYAVDASIRVKLEDGRWRVCDSSLLPL
jgi:hypothetical protein